MSKEQPQSNSFGTADERMKDVDLSRLTSNELRELSDEGKKYEEKLRDELRYLEESMEKGRTPYIWPEPEE